MKHSGQTVLWELWAAWWMAVPPQPLPPEQLMQPVQRLQPVQRQSFAALCGT